MREAKPVSIFLVSFALSLASAAFFGWESMLEIFH